MCQARKRNSARRRLTVTVDRLFISSITASRTPILVTGDRAGRPLLKRAERPDLSNLSAAGQSPVSAVGTSQISLTM